MAKFMDGKDPGKLAVNGKWTMKMVPRAKVSGKSGSISKQDSRGKDNANIK
jgi:hypothetical protein